jgi:hypothetical protein
MFVMKMVATQVVGIIFILWTLGVKSLSLHNETETSKHRFKSAITGTSNQEHIAHLNYNRRGLSIQENCDKCLTRDQQVSQNYASFIPLFVKFHKVGSGTISDLMRRHCRQIGGRLNTESLIPWRGGKFCGMIPHTHSSLTM